MSSNSSALISLPRLFFRSNGAILLFARFIDRAYLQSLVEELKELTSLASSSHESLLYSAEIELLASTIFYLPLLILHGATIGQNFCGLTPAGVVSVRKSEKVDNNSKSSVRSKIISAVLYILLPYLYSRKVEIYTLISEFFQFVVSDEGASEESDSSNDGSSPNEPQSCQVGTSPYASLAGIIWIAMKRSYYKISRETNVRFERILQFMNDFHLYFFTQNEKYLEWPLRITHMQLFTQSVTPISLQQIKLRSLSWMLGFRLVLLAYYAARVVMHEIDDQLLVLSSPVPDGNDFSVGQATKTSESSSIAAVSSMTTSLWGTCPLCLDSIQQAAVLPCGHMCCWECVTSYAFSAQVQQQQEGGGSQCKCPVCRHEFSRQRIRAIHS